LAQTRRISSDLHAARAIQNALLKRIASCGYSPSAIFAIKLAIEEGLTNAIKHGNRFDPAKVVQVRYEIDNSRAVITITDQGSGFNPAAVPDPTTDENLEKPSGRGIMLMRAYMDKVVFNRQGNQVRLIKRNA
jgi:serine/threonine-protein kinase RsbW